MKRRIISSSTNDSSWDMNYKPNITSSFIDEYVMPKLRDAINAKYGRRYKNLSIDFDDDRWSSGRIKLVVMPYNNGKLLSTGEFDFLAYNEYYDEDDFKQHVDRVIREFVSDLI